ncbi:MAG: hypothetical protein FJX60_07195 [Alphaproteobacteria bacterium]|nr:hypothetical protein [Alphaproteobacteria bacterium]
MTGKRTMWMKRPAKGGRDLDGPEQYLAKAQRFRERAAGLRHGLQSYKVPPLQRVEMERMLKNLEAAANELERLAKRRS